MGQKVHPYILRIGFGKDWRSRWFSFKKREYAACLDEDLKIRESEINDADSIYKLLQELGYEQILIVEKIRRLWHLGNCEVALDRLPLLGDFVEIEGPGEKEITNVQNSLGLTDLPHISKSYASLLKERLQQPDK